MESKRKFYIETYGCQMNVTDSELVVSILTNAGFEYTKEHNNADIIFVNTCSVRENAETRVRGRLAVFKTIKKSKKSLIVGVLGCMAERLKEKLLVEEQVVDMVVGPDAYRDLPNLLAQTENGQRAINVHLSREETYADISPVKLDENGVTSFVSIMRGCDNMCAFCIVPFTRGRERSREPETILNEIKQLSEAGYKEVTLLGQNVDKYNWNNGEINFANLLEKVANVDKQMRIRFATSYPQDMTDEVLYTMAAHSNICKYIHLPIQSGSDNMLQKMKRGYSREWYINRIEAIRKIIPNCSISTDIIAGFCAETEEDHQDTLSLMELVKYDFAYMFKYSVRPNTYAARNYEDDVLEEVKIRRLDEIIKLQNKISLQCNQKEIGKQTEILVEGISKRSNERYFGRTSQNKVVVFPTTINKIGTYVNVIVTSCTQATLSGKEI